MEIRNFEADEMAKLRSEFAANVSHELRTPLTSIKGFVDILLGGVVQNEEDRQRFLTMISVETDHMINLINDIMRLSELQEQEMPVISCSTDAMPVAREIQTALSESAKNAEVTIAVIGTSACFPIEPERIRILLMNLVENAVKYNQPGGTVTVEIGEGMIRVSDTGIGIPPEHQSRVFERFYRVDKSRSRKKGGTGLGLAIVKHITALYGGRLSLESAVGEGTTITIRFPTEKTAEEDPALDR